MSGEYTDGASGDEGVQESGIQRGAGNGGGPDVGAVEGIDAADDVARYAAEVRAELADLASDQSAELLEDLEDHLREVAAEDAGDLRTRLGTPTAYARELRSSAGFPPPQDGPSTAKARQRRAGIEDRIVTRFRRARATVVGHPFGAETAEFLPTLRPAWWVVRGWLAVVVLQFLTTGDSDGRTYPFPKVTGSTGLGFVLLLAAVVASVWFGQRAQLVGRQRRLLMLSHAGLAVVALFAIGDMQGRSGSGTNGDRSSYQYTATAQGLVDYGRQVTNLFVYDKDGHPVPDAFIYDQSGNPVVVSDGSDTQIFGGVNGGATQISLVPVGADGSVFETKQWQDSQGLLVGNVYPQHQVRFGDGPGQNGALSAIPWLTVQVPQGVHEVSVPVPGQQPGMQPTDSPQPTASSPAAAQSATPSTTATPSASTTSATTPLPGAPGAQQSSATSAPVQAPSGSATTR